MLIEKRKILFHMIYRRENTSENILYSGVVLVFGKELVNSGVELVIDSTVCSENGIFFQKVCFSIAEYGSLR